MPQSLWGNLQEAFLWLLCYKLPKALADPQTLNKEEQGYMLGISENRGYVPSRGYSPYIPKNTIECF